MLTAVVVTPFDVVKTRMQVSPPQGVGELAACPRCGVWVLNNGLMEHTLTKCEAWFATQGHHRHLSSATATVTSEGTLATAEMLSRVARTEGFSGLYAGIGPTLVMAVPNTALYFTAYDELRRSGLFPSVLAPALSGASARVVAATAVAPFELARTQLQALSPERRHDYLNHVSRVIQRDGLLRPMFRGLTPTLWRDVPFSAVYWGAYERVHRKNSLGSAFGSGLIAGAIAALVTTPFDVVKTRRMVETHTGRPVAPRRMAPETSRGTFGLLFAIAKTEGIPALFTGAVPRLLKVAPACAIMIGTYEYAKALFLRNGNGNGSSSASPPSSTSVDAVA